MDQSVDAVLELLNARFGRTALVDGHGACTRVNLWAYDTLGHSHADYDHYVQECEDCQRVWIHAVLECAQAVAEQGVAFNRPRARERFSTSRDRHGS
jgi:hypothetical protein